MSSTDAISPTPRTINQAPFDSSTLPPTFRLLSRTADDHRAERQVVVPEAVRIDVDLVLLDVAADRRHFGDARHGVELVADEPVLQAAEIAQRVASGSRPCTRTRDRRPVASGPSVGTTPAGRLFATRLMRSSTRVRAKYRSTLSSKTT